jgi:altronate hydrolase
MTTMILDASDNVLILVDKANVGDVVVENGLPLTSAVPAGHKIARKAIATGAPISKYGQLIGYAAQAISLGEHVHIHNCVFGDHAEAFTIGSQLPAAQAAIPHMKPRTFLGYARSDGHVGTRNMIALAATVNCSASVIKKAAQQIEQSGMLNNYPNVDGVVAFAHGTGCGMDGAGLGSQILEQVLWGYATHPNVGAALFVGLGCEVMQISRMKERYNASGQERFYGMTIRESGGTIATVERIVEHVKKMLPEVNSAKRTPHPLSVLTLGLQCGGSDAYSGITANPALGIASDLLVGHGGRVVLSETPEIFGAEQLLLSRAKSPQVGEDLIERLSWWKKYTELNGASMDNNPSPGNKAGGLTTILEKSLGAVAKGGHTPLNEVVQYAQKPTKQGLVFMDTPGYDPVSVTGQIAGGAQLIIFTTGRGSAFGSKPAPTIKLASNSNLYNRMPDDMDLNCGDIVSENTSIESKGDQILDIIVAIASGQKSKSEQLDLGDHEFVPWQIGAVM